MKELSVPEGFTINTICVGTMVVVMIEDRRAHPDFAGDRSADEWPHILHELAEADLDPARAVVALGSRNEPVGSDGLQTFNVGTVQMGWA